MRPPWCDSRGFSERYMKINNLPLLMLGVTMSCAGAPQMCFDQAGRDYGIDPLLLVAISIKESRLKADAVNKANSNGSEDVCGMQINSSHYGKLEKFNITRERLLKEPCICVYTGAWVLAKNFNSYGRNWDSVGIYNAGPKIELIKTRRNYADHIRRIYRVLLAQKNITGERLALSTASGPVQGLPEKPTLNNGK